MLSNVKLGKPNQTTISERMKDPLTTLKGIADHQVPLEPIAN